MALGKSMDFVFNHLRKGKKLKVALNPRNSKIPLFPNPPDRLFNYANEIGDYDSIKSKYQEKTFGDIGQIPSAGNIDKRIAIVGAGMAGTIIARELVKLGFNNITLIEGSNRIGGRLYSIPPTNNAANPVTVSEMGAMRMPFFDENLNGSGRTIRNCILDHFINLYDVTHGKFPNPGVSWETTKGTGIFLNEGAGTYPQIGGKKSIIQWAFTAEQTGTPEALPVPSDPNNILNVLLEKWSNFAGLIINQGVDSWNQIINSGGDQDPKNFNSLWRAKFWDALTQKYQGISFYQLAVLPVEDGGIGMNEAEVNLFYVIGAGDGSWGAFFKVSAMYVITTLLFGYGTDHQTIGKPLVKCELNWKDSYGNNIEFVLRGLQALPEMNLGLPAQYHTNAKPGIAASFMSKININQAPGGIVPDGFNLYLNSKVIKYNKKNLLDKEGSIELTWESSNSAQSVGTFDHVFVTSSPWSTVFNSDISGEIVGYEMKRAMNVSHNIMSVKVMLPLKNNYFSTSPLPAAVYVPQMIASDTYILQVYAYAQPSEAGILALSYTWEDDSQKLLSEDDDKKLADKLLEKFGSCLIIGAEQTGIVNVEQFKTWCETYIDKYNPVTGLQEYNVIHWEKEPLYKGCSKLYSPGTYTDNEMMYSYNQATAQKANPSNIYFAGDFYSFESGWTEGALRTAYDSLIWFLQNNSIPQFSDQIQYPTFNIGPRA